MEALELCNKLKALKRPAISRGWITPEAIQAMVEESGRRRIAVEIGFATNNTQADGKGRCLSFFPPWEEDSENAAKVLIDSSESQFERAEAYHVIGLRYLAIGDAETATATLRDAYEKTSVPYWPIGFWSLALAKRLSSAPDQIAGGTQLSK